jgi:hypothetical protein
MYHKYTFTYQKYKKKKNCKKRYYRLYSILRQLLAAYLRNHTCYYLSFVFLANLIWLLHCNAMHFDSFLLGVRHLFQVSVIFLCEVILVIHCCFQNKNLYQNYYKKYVFLFEKKKLTV